MVERRPIAPPESTPSAGRSGDRFDPSPLVAEELSLPVAHVRAAALLLAEGATVAFIARYRKEKTGGLDEVALHAIEERRDYLVALHERRLAILESIRAQGKLSPALEASIGAARSKAELEDLYAPWRPKRRTRASAARERGLEPLAKLILSQPPNGDARRAASAFVDPAKEVADADAALAGARDIAAEVLSERADVRSMVRQRFDREGRVETTAVKAKTKEPTKFEAYYDVSERAKGIPSHRFLAIERGETEGVLRVKVRVDEDALARDVARKAGVERSSPFAAELDEAARDASKRLLAPSVESDVRAELKEASDQAAVRVFAENLARLLLAAPLGRAVVLGIDPGQRTGCKCAVVDDTGKLLTHTVVNLVAGPAALESAKKTVADLVRRLGVKAIAVGNGTHGRETADFCRDLFRGAPGAPMVVLVSESGASVYSASDVAREEFPDLDLTVRGAISIARRLQDPLAELVKVDPKAIGVGQYQHDVQPTLLKRKLDEVVSSCVNKVGVELNTASAPLLARVAGIGPKLAKSIVKEREEKGAFRARKDLLRVPGLGPRAFEQAAGFVRVRGASHPLDESAVHPERYALVERIARDAGVELRALVGNEAAVDRIPWRTYVSEDVGSPTLEDIARELKKPGRDPRDVFEAPAFRDDVRSLADVRKDMVLEGVVTNVTAFGAFVDVGVHQDGLVHISQLADRFVQNPHDVVKVGDRLKVLVLEVDPVRKRISLSARGQR